ncbi:DUF4245 family protein [Nocardioides daejeonensis]|uniref:DUF4245 family protein n=1 Tax=Nocardioides daejeonensis TaxID=1046556 RepID=UPI0013A54562|nr:DUF4245 family protein [Nocardioides daejeonensis]
MSQERGGRYERSFSGMIGAMIVTIGVIVAFVLFRALVRDDLDVKRETVEYLPVVQALQDGGDIAIAYPPTIPEGWRSVGVGRSSNGWSLDLLTSDDEYAVGLRQEPRSVAEMLRVYVNDDRQAEKDGTVSLEGDLGPEWEVYRDASDGDYVLVTKLGEENLMVFSRAPEEQVRAYAQSLTTKLLAGAD